MPARKNGPRAGPGLGIKWLNMPVGKPVRYKGTPNGAKANASRAGKLYTPMRFRSFKHDGAVYVERIR